MGSFTVVKGNSFWTFFYMSYVNTDTISRKEFLWTREEVRFSKSITCTESRPLTYFLALTGKDSEVSQKKRQSRPKMTISLIPGKMIQQIDKVRIPVILVILWRVLRIPNFDTNGDTMTKGKYYLYGGWNRRHQFMMTNGDYEVLKVVEII